jgi:ubiquinone/menaquinone biosynthesis C-methylase UbiE
VVKADSDTLKAAKKWNNSAPKFDKFNQGFEKRYGIFKREHFSKCRGKVMLIAVGTGLDLQFLPENLDITAVDFASGMLKEASAKGRDYKGTVKLLQADAQELGVASKSFDTIVTSCTFCSVPDPVKGLRELRRVLRDDGRMLMFEHVRVSNPLLGLGMDIMAPIIALCGATINRRTGDNIRKAGFTITREQNIYLDMVKSFEAKKT